MPQINPIANVGCCERKTKKLNCESTVSKLGGDTVQISCAADPLQTSLRLCCREKEAPGFRYSESRAAKQSHSRISMGMLERERVAEEGWRSSSWLGGQMEL